MTMGILNIAPAERAGAHLLIQLYGPPRSGKTYTALRIARGMVGPKGKIGVLDTESGRARLYSDKVPGGFVVGELTPPPGTGPRRPKSSAPGGGASTKSKLLRRAGHLRVVRGGSVFNRVPGGVREIARPQIELG